jgi:hypothetical protein
MFNLYKINHEENYKLELIQAGYEDEEDAWELASKLWHENGGDYEVQFEGGEEE